MAYGRRERPVIAYPSAGRGAAANAPVRNNYRNKFITVLLVTVVYTAFLYRSGMLILFLLYRQIMLFSVIFYDALFNDSAHRSVSLSSCWRVRLFELSYHCRSRYFYPIFSRVFF
jgi:hypothetical protein